MSRALTVAASVVGILLVAGLLAAAHLKREGGPASAVQASPTPSVATLAYIARLNSDMDVLDVQVYKKLDCKTRAICVEELQTIRATTLAVLRDASDSPPSPMVRMAAQISLAGQAFLGQVDTSLQAVQQPNSDYAAASGVPDIHPLDIAAGGAICWPRKPIAVEGGESPSGYTCR